MSQLVRKQRSDPNFLRSLLEEDAQERNVQGILNNTVERLLLDNVKLHNAAIIQKEIDQKHHLEIPKHFIYKALTKDLDMKYRKVKKVPTQANSNRNL